MPAVKHQDLVSEFEGRVGAHSNSLYYYALKITNRREDAEDLFQETMYKAFKYFGKYDRSLNIRSWLFKIMTNVQKDRLRREMRESRVVDFSEYQMTKEIDELPASNELVSLEENVINQFQVEQLRAALNELPSRYGMVVALRDVEELEYKEIAEALDIPLGTVMSRLFRGRNMLKERLRAAFSREKGQEEERNEM